MRAFSTAFEPHEIDRTESDVLWRSQFELQRHFAGNHQHSASLDSSVRPKFQRPASIRSP